MTGATVFMPNYMLSKMYHYKTASDGGHNQWRVFIDTYHLLKYGNAGDPI